MRPAGTIDSLPARYSEALALYDQVYLSFGSVCDSQNAGTVTMGSPKLLGPLSMTRIDKFLLASASLPATMQPAAPPALRFSYGTGERRRELPQTSGDDDINVSDVVREILVEAHCVAGAWERNVTKERENRAAKIV